MSMAEIVGYVAALVTLGTYSMKTMIPLRMFGIAANVLFIAFGYMAGIYPTLILHVVLLPLNSLRLYQMLQLTRRVIEASHGDLNMDWLKPFMSPQSVATGEVLFRKGDPANDLFFLVSGRYRLVETGKDISPGEIVGELGFLEPSQTRTRTLECVEAGTVLRISYHQLKQLYFQNPTFGFYLLRLTSQRLFADIANLESELMAQANAPTR